MTKFRFSTSNFNSGNLRMNFAVSRISTTKRKETETFSLRFPIPKLVIGYWCLVVIWSLVFGYWSFPARAMGNKPKEKPKYKLEILKLEVITVPPSKEAKNK